MTINPSTTYYAKVKNITLQGESPYSNVISVTTLASDDLTLGVAPLPPTAPSITQTEVFDGYAIVVLSLPFSNEYNKEIKIDVSVNFDFSSPLYSNFTYVIGTNTQKTLDSLLLTIGGLLPATLHYIRLRYSNAVGISANTTITVATLSTLQAPDSFGVINLTAIAARLTWGKISNSITYFVDLATDALFTSLILSNVNVGNVFFRDAIALVESTDYYYRARASDGSVVSRNSNVVKFTTLASVQTYANQFFNLSVPVFKGYTKLYATSIQLNWDGDSKTEYYSIDIATDSIFATIVQADIRTTNNNLILSGLTAGTSYYARVKSVTVFQTTVYSISQTFRTLNINTTLNAPQLLTPTTFNSKSILLQWVLRSYATSYYIELSTSSVFASILHKIFVSNVNSVVLDTSILPATTYYMRIRALNTTETSNFSNVVTVTTSGALPAITILAATNITDSATKLNWTTNAAYTNYIVYIYEQATGSEIGNGFYSKILLGFVNNCTVDLFLKAGTTYSWLIVGQTASEDITSSVYGTFSTKASSPVLQIANTILSWVGNLNNIEVSTDNTFKFLLQGYPRSVTNSGVFDMTAVVTDKNDYYIRGNFNGGEYSNIVSTVQGNPYIVKIEVTDTTAKVTWKKSLVDINYLLVKSNNLSVFTNITEFLFPKSMDSAKFYVIQNLTANTQYSVQIAASEGIFSQPLLFTTNRFANEAVPPTTSSAAPTITLSYEDFDRALLIFSGSTTYLVNVARDSNFQLDNTYYETIGSLLLQLKPSRTYYVRAYGYNGTNRTTNPSSTFIVNTDNLPAYASTLTVAPVISSVVILNENQAQVTFVNLIGATDYTLEISKVSTFSVLVPLNISRTGDDTFLVEGLLVSIIYYARLYGYNANSTSSFSNVQTIQTI